MYYGHQDFEVIERMSDWRRKFAFDAVWAVIRAESRKAEADNKQAEIDRRFNDED